MSDDAEDQMSPSSPSSSTLPTRVAFEDISTHAALVAWSRDYARRVVDVDDVAVDLSLVDWEVSTRAKRRAAAVKRPRLSDAVVGTPFDWKSVGTTDDTDDTDDTDRADDARRCTVSLTWAASDAFSREEWTATLRHELIHVEQFQRFGTTDHGARFERRAETLDTPVRCRRFATPKYVLTCRNCGAVVARRYRDCTLVSESDQYQSSCCAAAIHCERVSTQ